MIFDRFRKPKSNGFPVFEEGSVAREIGDVMSYVEDLHYLRESEAYVDQCVASRVKHSREFRLKHLVIVGACLVLCLLTFFMYLRAVSDRERQKVRVNNVSREYSSLVSENAFLENEISKTIDYAAVYTFAVEDLGMTLPEKRQIVDYPAGKEYVIKEGDIPK